MSQLSSAAIEVLGALFVRGPLWDGNIPSKSGRGELIEIGFAFYENGWTALTQTGLRAAIEWPTKNRADIRWNFKQRNLD